MDLVRGRRKVSVDELAETLDISRETIRRDLTELASRHLLRKVHGGATPPEPQGEGVFSVRMGERAGEKRAIARRGAELFAPGDTIFVDTGTTTLVFAEALARRQGLTVITNSLDIAQTMGRAANGHTIYLLGGQFSQDASETLGPLAVDQIGTFHAAHAVLTVGAVNVTGMQDFNLEEAHIARAMLRQAQLVTVLADDSKFEQHALFPIAGLDRIDRLVSNAAPGPELAKALHEAGVEMIVAEVADD